MKRSGDLVIGKSGDRKRGFTAETLRRGENQKPTTEARRHGENLNKPTTETQRHGEESGECAGLYQGTGFSRAAKSKNIWALAPAVFGRAMRTFRAALREIFDESAYDRFLLRKHASRSVASYREFTRERDAAMLEKPRCC
ncbi:MAG TPA: hypothetical protein VGK01_08230 [Candidatus Angelobacter sp.]|jgi:hypothetical protein